MMKAIKKSFLAILLLLLPAVCVRAQENTATASVTAQVSEINEFGTIYLDLSLADLEEAGIHLQDIVTVTVNGKSVEMPVTDPNDYGMFGQPLCIANDKETRLSVFYFSFVKTFGIGEQVVDGDGYTWEWAEGTSQPETVSIELTEPGAYTPVETWRMGIMSLLNLSEDVLIPYVRVQNYALAGLINAGFATVNPETTDYMPADNISVTSFDTLNTLLLGLQAENIDYALVSESVANYICSQNNGIKAKPSGFLKENFGYIEEAMYNVLFNDYAIMLREDKADLRDEIDAALDDMREEGVLDELIKEYITDLADETPRRVKFDQFDGAETIRFVVTGDLPPMDYVEADLTPAGFSTAVLAEIGRRLEKNIEVISTENLSRSLELQNGTADAAFWTRTKNSFEDWMTMFDTKTLIEKTNADKLPTEGSRFAALTEMIGEDANFLASLISDLPEGLLTTQAYYTEPVVLIYTKE